MSELSAEFMPQEMRVMLPCSGRMIGDVMRELGRMPKSDAGVVREYHASRRVAADGAQFPKSVRFSRVIPDLKAAGRSLRFDYLRFSTVADADPGRYRLDAVPEGEAGTGRLRMWRLVLNLAREPHVFRYLNRPPGELEVTPGRGYEGYPPEDIVKGAATALLLNKRSSHGVDGVLFPSSEVLYGGTNEGPGYLASYVAVERIPDET